MASIEFSGVDGEGTLSYNGKSVTIRAKPGFDYTKDLTVTPDDCYRRKKSKEFNNYEMEYVVGPIQWVRGAYIHQGNTSTKSAGCIKVGEDDAQDFYDWVKGRNRTRITIKEN